MAKFEGNVDVVFHPEKGLSIQRGTDFNAGEAGELLETMVSAAKDNKVGIDRWCLYIPEVSQTLARESKQIPVAKVTKAIKDGHEPTLTVGKWGKPRLVLAAPVATKTTTRKITKIARK